MRTIATMAVVIGVVAVAIGAISLDARFEEAVTISVLGYLLLFGGAMLRSKTCSR